LGVEVSRGYVICDKEDNDSMELDEKREEKFKIKGRVDFYINSDRQWALELLVRGDLVSKTGWTGVEEHQFRFIGGIYENLPKKRIFGS